MKKGLLGKWTGVRFPSPTPSVSTEISREVHALMPIILRPLKETPTRLYIANQPSPTSGKIDGIFEAESGPNIPSIPNQPSIDLVYTKPCAFIASATLINPAMLAPMTRLSL